MIRRYFPHPTHQIVNVPVWFHQLKAGDWFSFTPTLDAVWVMGNHSVAVCLQTGTQADNTWASRQKCWRVVADVQVEPRSPV